MEVDAVTLGAAVSEPVVEGEGVGVPVRLDDSDTDTLGEAPKDSVADGERVAVGVARVNAKTSEYISLAPAVAMAVYAPTAAESDAVS